MLELKLSWYGVIAGMPRDKAYNFAAQAGVGVAKIILDANMYPGKLKDIVCFPAYVTIDAVRVFE